MNSCQAIDTCPHRNPVRGVRTDSSNGSQQVRKELMNATRRLLRTIRCLITTYWGIKHVDGNVACIRYKENVQIMKSNRNFAQAGFSLIELLVVVAIMLVVAAIAVPAVIASAQAGNEAAAANTMRTMVTAENGYHQLYGNYSAKVADLGGAVSATACPNIPAATAGCFLADSIAQNVDGATPTAISGFDFTYTVVGDGYTLIAKPHSDSKGRKTFYVDQSGSIHTAAGATSTPTATSPLLGS